MTLKEIHVYDNNNIQVNIDRDSIDILQDIIIELGLFMIGKNDKQTDPAATRRAILISWRANYRVAV